MRATLSVGKIIMMLKRDFLMHGFICRDDEYDQVDAKAYPTDAWLQWTGRSIHLRQSENR